MLLSFPAAGAFMPWLLIKCMEHTGMTAPQAGSGYWAEFET